jgi:hypothetical protein
MKKKHLILLFTSVLLFGSCAQLRQMANLRKCEFRIESVNNTQLAGINVENIRRFSDLNIGDVAKVTTAYITGNLPLEFNLNLQVRNPNTSLAALNKFDWIAMIDQTEILAGTSNQRVEVPANGGMAMIPLNIKVNLKEIFEKKSKKEAAEAAFGLADGQKKPIRVALKLKPSIQVGKKAIMYPGWFSVKRGFTSGS